MTKKIVKQLEYRAEQAEAELNAVKSSKAYKVSKLLGKIKNEVKANPASLAKKVAKTIITEPQKLIHAVRIGKRRVLIQQSVVQQTGKYQEWILLNEPDYDELEEQRKASEKFKYKPVVSIITPVFNPPVDVLEELIESVLEQTYSHFELCLGDFGNSPAVKELLQRYSANDERIKYWEFTDNRGIAYNSNQILEKAKGEYIGLLDHDDTLSPDALYENVKLLNQDSYDFIYSNKDKIDEKGNRFDPLFKPELSPEMLLNINYLTHFNVMRTRLVRQVGAWDPETDGAQDWDLFLKIISKSEKVGYIPKILYHWRVIASSTALSIETKPYALAGQRKAVDKYLDEKGINARAYTKKTELFIKWGSVEMPPAVFIYFSNIAYTKRTIREIRKTIPDASIYIIVTSGITDTERAGLGDYLVIRESELFTSKVATYLSDHPHTLFIRDSIKLPKTDWFHDLRGWLSIDDVASVSGRLISSDDLILDSGGFISKHGVYEPLFIGLPRFYQAYIGNAEWVRNLSCLSGNFFVTKTEQLRKYIKVSGKSASFDNYFIWLSSTENKRLVMTPHVTARISDPNCVTRHKVDTPKGFIDKYRPYCLSDEDPMRLFDGEDLAGIEEPDNQGHLIDRYQSDATILARSYDISDKQLRHNQDSINAFGGIENPQSVCWILPSFDAVYAGLMNIFTFAEYLTVDKGIRTTFLILKAGSDTTYEKELVVSKVPALKSATFKSITEQTPLTIHYDIGIATLWSTAFVLAKATDITRKCYFIQDNETNFYPKGTVSALADMSYRFGFYAIANTPGLLDWYKHQYGGEGTMVTSKVDLSAYTPRKDIHYVPKKPYKVFFYARPNMPRNAFELGIAALRVLKEDLGDDVEIITAGAEWDPSTFGLEVVFTNLGKIAYESVPKLYRSVDAGLMFMFSGHPGVTASELMASGCPVVVNEYDDITWNELYVHEETCLVTLPVASEVARNLKRCLTDTALREKIIKGGLRKSKEFYTGYEKSLSAAYKDIVSK